MFVLHFSVGNKTTKKKTMNDDSTATVSIFTMLNGIKNLQFKFFFYNMLSHWQSLNILFEPKKKRKKKHEN